MKLDAQTPTVIDAIHHEPLNMWASEGQEAAEEVVWELISSRERQN